MTCDDTVRKRACGAVLREHSILMVLHREGGRSYWTLPGGGVEPGESSADAAVRECFEETSVRTRPLRLLWNDVDQTGQTLEECFLLEIVDASAEPCVGADPEESELPREQQQLQAVAWRRLSDVRDDVQVSRVLEALRLQP